MPTRTTIGHTRAAPGSAGAEEAAGRGSGELGFAARSRVLMALTLAEDARATMARLAYLEQPLLNHFRSGLSIQTSCLNKFRPRQTSTSASARAPLSASADEFGGEETF